MPRPIKCRKVCHFPDILEFRPSNKNGGRGEEDEKEVILLTVDEYETIRLIDKEGYRNSVQDLCRLQERLFKESMRLPERKWQMQS